jgi:hypothetical protein
VQRGRAGQVPGELCPGRGLRRLHQPGPFAGASSSLASDRRPRGRGAGLRLPRQRDGLVCLLPAQVVRACRFHFGYGVLPRCSVCPLFDAERAIRDIMGENPPGNVLEITLGPKLRALLAGELPPDLDLDFELPDFPPEGWENPPLKNRQAEDHQLEAVQRRPLPGAACAPRTRRTQLQRSDHASAGTRLGRHGTGREAAGRLLGGLAPPVGAPSGAGDARVTLHVFERRSQRAGR